MDNTKHIAFAARITKKYTPRQILLFLSYDLIRAFSMQRDIRLSLSHLSHITYRVICDSVKNRPRFKERTTNISVVLRAVFFAKSFFILNHCQVHCSMARRTYYDLRLALKVHFSHLNGIKLPRYNLTTMPFPNDKICILFTFASRAADNENKQPTSALVV